MNNRPEGIHIWMNDRVLFGGTSIQLELEEPDGRKDQKLSAAFRFARRLTLRFRILFHRFALFF